MRVKTSPFFELALVVVRLDHVARRIVNADYRIMGAAVKLPVANCIADCVRLGIFRPRQKFENRQRSIGAPLARSDLSFFFDRGPRQAASRRSPPRSRPQLAFERAPYPAIGRGQSQKI